MTQNDSQKLPGKLNIRFMTPARAAEIFSYVYTEAVTEQQVRDIATRGEILRPDDTFDLIHYCAYIVKEMGRGTS